MGTYERKTREIKQSLHRRARIRRAYFKMIGEDPKKGKNQDDKAKQINDGEEIDLDAVSDSENEEEAPKRQANRGRPGKGGEKRESASGETEPKLTGRQLARRRRAEEYHQKKEREASIERARNRRDTKKHTMMKRSAKGQPKLGSQMGVLLDKIRKSSA